MRKLILACALAAISAIAGAQTLVVGALQPAIVYRQAPTSNPPVAATTIYTTPAGSNQVYRLCGHVIITTAATGGTVAASLIYTSQAHAFTAAAYELAGTGLTGVNLSATVQWNQSAGCYAFAADASTVIQAWLAPTSITGSPAYLYDVTLERLQ